MAEHLTAAAILRAGQIHTHGYKSHWQIRAALGDADPTRKNPNDEDGFLTSDGRFVTRAQAVSIGIAAGQLRPSWASVQRELLSSDIRW